MDAILIFNENLKIFDSEKIGDVIKYKIRVIHDNSIEDYMRKFKFEIYNINNELCEGIELNGWSIKWIITESYYTRARVGLLITDPLGVNLPFIYSGGTTLSVDESYNLEWVFKELTNLISYKFCILSCFKNYRSMLDFNNIVSGNGDVLKSINFF
ncbi:MAG: hypothetical protein JXR53_11005 [Bacteroidales bacterium]|nr:hypothetical protein [Bacteroidales bacterium]